MALPLICPHVVQQLSEKNAVLENENEKLTVSNTLLGVENEILIAENGRKREEDSEWELRITTLVNYLGNQIAVNQELRRENEALKEENEELTAKNTYLRKCNLMHCEPSCNRLHCEPQ